MALKAVDRSIALIVGTLCVVVALMGIGMRGDSGILPVIASTLGGLACLGIGISTFQHQRPKEAAPSIKWRRFLIWLTCVIALLLMMMTLGTFIALNIFLLASLCCLSNLRWPIALLIALSFSVLIYIVFVYLLSIPLPSGLLAS